VTPKLGLEKRGSHAQFPLGRVRLTQQEVPNFPPPWGLVTSDHIRPHLMVQCGAQPAGEAQWW
jgi:hypothetical protein